jgi:hypothetical protein
MQLDYGHISVKPVLKHRSLETMGHLQNFRVAFRYRDIARVVRRYHIKIHIAIQCQSEIFELGTIVIITGIDRA